MAKVKAQTRMFGLATVAVLAISSAAFWRKSNRDAQVESTSNWLLSYDKPKGWVERNHSPQTLFLFENPDTKVILRGATNQVISDFNPTPNLDRDGLTKQFAEVTVDNLGWKATILDTVAFKGGTYRLIRRETVDRTVITGIAVRGNTTVMITLLGIGKAKEKIDVHMPLFKDYLASTSLTRTQMD